MQKVKLLCRQMIVLSHVHKLSGETMLPGMDWETKKMNQLIKDLTQLVGLKNSVRWFLSLSMILFAHVIQEYF